MSRESRVRTLMLPRREFERIKENTELGSRHLEEQERQTRQKEAQAEATLRAANQLAATLEKQYDAERAAVTGRVEARRRCTITAVAKSRDSLREQTERQLSRERRLHFWERDGVKQLHSALQLAEVLREREIQAQLKKTLRSHDKDEEQLLRAKVLSNVEDARAQEREKRMHLEQEKIKLREALNKQMAEHEMIRKEDKAELVRERKEEIELYEKFCEEMEKEKSNGNSKRNKYIREFLEASENDRDYRRSVEEEDRLEKKICDLYINFKDRMKHKLEAKRRAALKENIRNRELKSIYLLVNEKQNREKEKEWMKKVENECLERERKASALRAARAEEQRRSALELQAYQTKIAEEQQIERNRVDEEAIEARYRHDRVTRAWSDFKYREKQETHKRNAQAYAEQRERKRLEEKIEEAHNLAADERRRIQGLEEDREFLEYANQILQEAEEIGRPNIPLKRALESYKKKFGIDRVKFVKASMRSQLDIGVNEMRDHKFKLSAQQQE